MQPDFFKGFDAMLQRIGARIPYRVVWGDKDSFISVEYANRFPTKDVTILPEAGHWVALLAPDAVASAVEALSA
jgi:pimeloyl-ACP methyl ester carboxylesterase